MGLIMGEKLRIGKYTIPALLLLALIVGTAAAAVYVILQFTATVTVQANPAVSFYEWATDPKKNTFDETFNIFPDVKTINDNATHAIYNWETSNRTAHLRISSITNSGNIQKVNMTLVGTAVGLVWNSGDSLPTSWVTFTATAGTKYTIRIEVTATGTASVGTTSVVTFEMKVEQP